METIIGSYRRMEDEKSSHVERRSEREKIIGKLASKVLGIPKKL